MGYIQTCNTWDLLGGDLGFGNQQLIGVVAFHDRWLHFHSLRMGGFLRGWMFTSH